MKDYQGALEDLTRAIETARSFPGYYLDRGIVLILLNRDEEAQKDFDKYQNIALPAEAKTMVEKRIAEAKKTREENN